MFYSHEVLTSRKYGVATVWLVATLGSKSSLKRINRKQILDVDVSKACQTIVDPVAPMALRLQGNLLYGVSRVYLQQCGYVLSDAQSASNAMKLLLRTVKDGALDPDAGRARPEQLILQDDPSFLPEHVLHPPDLFADLNLGFDAFSACHARDSQSLTSFGIQQSQISSEVGALGGLVLPTSSPSEHGKFRLEGDNDLGGNTREPSGIFSTGGSLGLDEPDFTFGDDGNFIQLGYDDIMPKTPRVQRGAAIQSDTGVSARVWREHEEGRKAGAQIPNDNMDIDLPIYDDELLPGESSSSGIRQQSSEHWGISESSSSTVAALMRRKPRAARALPTDRTIELRNADLVNWNTNYLQNMKEATRLKAKVIATSRAKKNAEHYVWGSGLGGIGKAFLGARGSHPFDIYIGDKFFELVTGLSRQRGKAEKHDRDSGIDDATQDESRRVRQKTTNFEGEIPRGIDEENFFPPDSDDVEVELPREVATALDDQQIFSAMPWNMSASIRGSSALPRSGLGSLDHGRRGNRLVSASPLLGRGQASWIEMLQCLESEGDYSLGEDDFALPGISSDYPEPVVPFQTSTSVRDALSAEGANFLAFVIDAIAEKRSRTQIAMKNLSDALQAEAAADIDEITFGELLAPDDNTRLIACQGLMMVLGLGSKGMLHVHQSEHLGEIALRLTQQAHASQVIEMIDHRKGLSQGGSHVDAEADGRLADQPTQAIRGVSGHSREQITTGHVAPHEDDYDELYDY